MNSITFLTLILILFVLAPYISTITTLRGFGIKIRYSNNMALGLEIAAFFPFIVASNIFGFWITNLIYLNLKKHLTVTWYDHFFYMTFIKAAFNSNYSPYWPNLNIWFVYYFIFILIHFGFTVILFFILKKAITDIISLESQRSDLKFYQKGPFYFSLVWLKSFGIWNELSEDFSYSEIYRTKKTMVDLSLCGAGDVLYRGKLNSYSDIGSFKGIVLTDVSVKKIYLKNNCTECNNEGAYFEVIPQYPHKSPDNKHQVLSKVFFPFDKIYTLHHRINYIYENYEKYIKSFDSQDSSEITTVNDDEIVTSAFTQEELNKLNEIKDLNGD